MHTAVNMKATHKVDTYYVVETSPFGWMVGLPAYNNEHHVVLLQYDVLNKWVYTRTSTPTFLQQSRQKMPGYPHGTFDCSPNRPTYYIKCVHRQSVAVRSKTSFFVFQLSFGVPTCEEELWDFFLRGVGTTFSRFRRRFSECLRPYKLSRRSSGRKRSPPPIVNVWS